MAAKLITILKKHADISRHKIIIPKYFIEKFGYEYEMEVYEDCMVIRPLKERE